MNAVEEAIDELRFQEKLKRLSELPQWKKVELWNAMNRQEWRQGELTLKDLERILYQTGEPHKAEGNEVARED